MKLKNRKTAVMFIWIIVFLIDGALGLQTGNNITGANTEGPSRTDQIHPVSSIGFIEIPNTSGLRQWNSSAVDQNLTMSFDEGVAAYGYSSPVKFLIKTSVYYICWAYYPHHDAWLGSYQINVDDSCIMELIVKDKEWGYIRQVQSGLHFQLKYMFNNYSQVLLGNPRDPQEAYFAIDQPNNRIVSITGYALKLLIWGDYPYQGAFMYTGSTDHVRFPKRVTKVDMVPKFMNISQPDKEVLPYGALHVSADWVLIFGVINPLATYTKQITHKLGYSKSKSKSGTTQYGFEVEASAEAWFMTFSASASYSKEISETSSETWSAEDTVTDKYTVEKGQSVAFWQRIFIGDSAQHTAVFQSTIYQHTHNPNVKPTDDSTERGYNFPYILFKENYTSCINACTYAHTNRSDTETNIH